MLLKIQLSSEEASFLAELACSETKPVSEFARSAIMEKIEDLHDRNEFRSAVELDSGERFTADEVLRELWR